MVVLLLSAPCVGMAVLLWIPGLGNFVVFSFEKEKDISEWITDDTDDTVTLAAQKREKEMDRGGGRGGEGEEMVWQWQ